MSELFLSVVIPVRDEVESLEMLHRELDAALEAVQRPCELIFVDDGSRDGSTEALRQIEQKDPRVRLLVHPESRGQAEALETGFRAARGELTATLDADLQNDPAEIPMLIAHLEHADVVNGVRVDRSDSRLRRWVSTVANALRNRLTEESVSDVGCSLRVMRTRYLRGITLESGMHRFLPTLLRLEGARIAEVPVSHRPRRFGRSKYGMLDRLGEAVVDLFAVRKRVRRARRIQPPANFTS